MAKLTKEEISAIVKKHGYRLVADARRDSRTAPAEASTPDLSRLQAKYAAAARGSAREAATDAAGARRSEASADDVGDDDDAIVLAEPETVRDALTRGNRPKAKVISGRSRKITGSQG